MLLWWSDGFGRGADYRNGVQYARDTGLFIENIHTPVQEQDNLSIDNLDEESLLKNYLQCIKDCAHFDIPTMIVHLPDNKYPINVLGMDRIKRIVEEAEKLDINVAMENLRNIQNVTCVLNSIDSKKVGFCYDSCHHLNYDSERDLLGEYANRLMAIHLHDNGGVMGQHQLPFDGNVKCSTVMRKIAETGYLGATSLEPMNWGYEDLSIQEFLNNAFKRAKKLEEMRIT